MMFESSSENRKSWGGRQMVRHCIPDTRSNRWEWFGGCHGGFTCENTYWQSWRRAECSRRYISRDEKSKIGWLLKLQHPVSNRSDFKANSVANRKPMQIGENRCDVAEPRFFATTRARVFWTRWRRARLETDVPARRELQKSSREPTIAAAMVLDASVVREARMWRSARIWK